jgi:TPR repeat protein|tara:strand:+ start:146 stop:712 length:567 start_codon:yes stop_codon:yes gene_type:complete
MINFIKRLLKARPKQSANTIYKFGYDRDKSFKTNETALLDAHTHGVDNAALTLAFLYLNAEADLGAEGVKWLRVAAQKKNISSIAAHTHLARCYLNGTEAEKDASMAFKHNEIFKILYVKFWPNGADDFKHKNSKFDLHKSIRKRAVIDLDEQQIIDLSKDAATYANSVVLTKSKTSFDKYVKQYFSP